MRRKSVPSPTSSPAARARRGFSFVELMFAVMILGVGLIMTAGMFPVAISQVHASTDETVSAAIAWNAFNLMQEMLVDDELPPMAWHDGPGIVRSFRDPQAPGTPGLPVNALPEKYQINGGVRFGSNRPTAVPGDRLWQRVSANMIVCDDPRYAWVGFFQRSLAANEGYWRPHANVIVVVARAQDGSQFNRQDVAAAAPLSLQPRPVTFNLTSDGDGPVVDQVVEFTGGDKGAVVEGAFLIVANDLTWQKEQGWPQSYENGRAYRIGNHVDGDKWELSAESEYRALFPGPHAGEITTGLSKAGGFIVGRPSGPGGFLGPVQDLAVYSMIVPCRPQVQSP